MEEKGASWAWGESCRRALPVASLVDIGCSPARPAFWFLGRVGADAVLAPAPLNLHNLEERNGRDGGGLYDLFHDVRTADEFSADLGEE